MSKMKEYYMQLMEKIPEDLNERFRDDEYQLIEYMRSLTTKTDGKYALVKRRKKYFIMTNIAEIHGNIKYEVLATADNTSHLEWYCSYNLITKWKLRKKDSTSLSNS
jgi:hypothetical protein